MDVTDLTSPALEPVSLARVKLFLRVDHDNEDDLIADMIKAARLQIEDYCGVSLITRSRRFSLPLKTDGHIVINHYPLLEIEAVRVIDKRGGKTVLTASDYTANLRSRPVRFHLEAAKYAASSHNLEVDAVAGYGPSEADIPAPFMQAILLLTAQFYERGDDRPADIPLMVQALLMPYRGVRL